MIDGTRRAPPVFQACTLYFVLVFGAGFAIGVLRVLWLLPRYGARSAELIEMPFMLLAIVLAARHVVRRCALPARAGVRLSVGWLAFALMGCAEFSFAWLLQGLSPACYVASRDPVSGSVYLALLVLFALLPWLLALDGDDGPPRSQAASRQSR